MRTAGLEILEAGGLLLAARIARTVPPRYYLGRAVPNAMPREIGAGREAMGRSAACPERDLRVRRLAVRVTWAADRLGLRLSCLDRALTLRWMLRRRGYRPALCLGLSSGTDGPREAHAWLTLGDRVILGGGNLGRYVPLGRFG